MSHQIMGGLLPLAAFRALSPAWYGGGIGKFVTTSTGSFLDLPGRFPPTGGRGGFSLLHQGGGQTAPFLFARKGGLIRPEAGYLSKVAQVTRPKVIRWYGEYRVWSEDLHRFIKIVDRRPDGLTGKGWCDAILRADPHAFQIERLLFAPSPTADAVQRAPATGYQVQGDCHSPVTVVLWDRTSLS